MLHYITEELHLHEISSDQTLHLYMLSCASKVYVLLENPYN